MNKIFGLVFCLILFGCILGCSHTVTNSDGTTTTSEYTWDNEQLSGLVNVVNGVWTIVAQVITATKDITFTEEVVKNNAVVIATMAYTTCGKIPTANEIAVYIKDGSKPSKAALERFKTTGILTEVAE
jgi:hypothetical protein